jgi:hypothetical protein
MPKSTTNEVLMEKEVQGAFNKLFPGHEGHSVAKLMPVTDLTMPFRCSCGETLRVTWKTIMGKKDDLFVKYFKDLCSNYSQKFNELQNEAFKIGFVLVDMEWLADLHKGLIRKEGEQI